MKAVNVAFLKKLTSTLLNKHGLIWFYMSKLKSSLSLKIKLNSICHCVFCFSLPQSLILGVPNNWLCFSDLCNVLLILAVTQRV